MSILHVGVCFIIATAAGNTLAAHPSKEFLTKNEIELIQDAQEIDARVKVYLDAARLRLKVARERLSGKEPEQGDPFELFSLEDLLDGYYRILQSVMLNLDDAFQKPGPNRGKVRSALKNLKKTSENAATELESLKKLAEKQQREQLWNLLNQAIEINRAALEGAQLGLSSLPGEPAGKEDRRR